MGWEQRGGGSYYYRKEREGGRVRSKYMGNGVLGQICAENDRDEQRDRTAKRDADHATRQTEAEVDRQLADAESAIVAITDAALLAGGYHKHKGQWRKRRHEKKATASEDTRSVERDQDTAQSNGRRQGTGPAGR